MHSSVLYEGIGDGLGFGRCSGYGHAPVTHTTRLFMWMSPGPVAHDHVARPWPKRFFQSPSRPLSSAPYAPLPPAHAGGTLAVKHFHSLRVTRTSPLCPAPVKPLPQTARARSPVSHQAAQPVCKCPNPLRCSSSSLNIPTIGLRPRHVSRLRPQASASSPRHSRGRFVQAPPAHASSRVPLSWRYCRLTTTRQGKAVRLSPLLRPRIRPAPHPAVA